MNLRKDSGKDDRNSELSCSPSDSEHHCGASLNDSALDKSGRISAADCTALHNLQLAQVDGDLQALQHTVTTPPSRASSWCS